MPTQDQIDKALKAGYSQDDINKQLGVYNAQGGGAKIPGSGTSSPVYSGQAVETKNKDNSRSYNSPLISGTPTPTPSNVGAPSQSTGLTDTQIAEKNRLADEANRLGTGGTGVSTGVVAPTNTPSVPGTLNIGDLSSELQGVYNSDPYAKAAFDMAAKSGQQAWDDTIQKYTGIVQNTQENEKYLSEKAKNEQAQAAIVQGENVQNLQRGIEKADSNFNYASGSSAQSSVATTAVGKQMQQMHTQLANYIALNKLQNDGYSKAVAEQMRQIEVGLQQQIGKVLKDALGSLDNGVATGEIATDAQLKAMFEKNSEALLKQNPALSQNAFNQMNALMDGFIRQQDQNRETAANNFVVNEAISAETGVLTNMNGTPILDLAGNQIKVDPVAPLPPQFNKDTGEVVTFTKNANGTIVGNTTKVEGYTKPVVDDWITIKNDDGSITLWSPSTKQRQDVPLAGTGGSTGTGGGGGGTFTPPKGFESRALGQSIPVQQEADGNISINIKDGTTLGQCGTLANDYGSQLAGYKRVGDTWESKKANINSKEPVAGGLVMWTPGSFEENGHIGIVEKVFSDGSFQIFDTNYVSKGKASHRVIRPGDKEYNLIQSDGGFFAPDQVGGGESGGDVRSLGQFMKDNQQMGPGYSEADVKRFDEKIDRFVANNDEKSMAKAYREMLLRDTDFKKEFDNTQKFTRALDDVTTMINSYEKAGKSTNALKAMAEKVARSMGTTTDVALTQLQTQMGFTLANYIRSISGTAASDVEVQRLMGNMAKIGNVKELNTALVDQARNNATSALKSMVDTRMYGLPEALKPQVFGDIYTTGGGSAPQGNNAPAGNNTNNPLGL